MRLYRLENAEGKGPYQDRYTLRNTPHGEPAFLRDLYRSETLPGGDPHPAPSRDGIEGWIEHHEFFACQSPELLLAWFFREWHDALALEHAGQWVRILEVPDEHVRLGGRQCVYNHHYATGIRTLSPTEFEQEFLQCIAPTRPSSSAPSAPTAPTPLQSSSLGSWPSGKLTPPRGRASSAG